MPATPRRRCDLCDATLPPHGFYVVRIDVFAEPSIPPTTADELDDADLPGGMQALIDQMKTMTPDELQDDVHRRFEYAVCRRCQRKVLANPLGKPRAAARSDN